MSDQSRTTIELVKAMNSLVEFLRFTGEDYTMFPSERLPTLDTEIWFENGKFYHSFYEKPQTGLVIGFSRKTLHYQLAP